VFENQTVEVENQRFDHPAATFAKVSETAGCYALVSYSARGEDARPRFGRVVVQFGKISHSVRDDRLLLCLSFRVDARNLSLLMKCPLVETAPPPCVRKHHRPPAGTLAPLFFRATFSTRLRKVVNSSQFTSKAITNRVIKSLA
jgi:hypothetical protein